MPAKKPAFSTKIQLVALADITPYDRNPRNNDSAVRLVRASIEQFGFKVPIILDAAHVIVCGHTRYKAAQELGLDSVPCIIADDLTPAQIKAYRLADNKVGEAAEWDLDKLAEELAGCVPDFDMAAFGFEDSITPTAEIPECNKSIDEAAMEDTENECPKCGFKW
jgi:ParB family transcriptional regulator, chromosome partitioning protein